MKNETIEINKVIKSEEYKILSIVFDSDLYINTCKEKEFDGLTPILHYILRGSMGSGRPFCLFDTDWYLKKYPEVLSSQYTPFGHYLVEGYIRNFSPHPLFDANWYSAGNEVVNAIPLIDYLNHEHNWRRPTHPLFDGAWYLDTNPDVANARINPLRHFIQSGARELRNPSPLFFTSWYFDRHPELLHTGKNPLVDYVDRLDFKGRDPNPQFFSEWYLLNNKDVDPNISNPLSHYITTGCQEGRDPNPYFDTNWYRARYYKNDSQNIDPLAHYLILGGREAGYITCPVDRHTQDCDALDISYEIFRLPKDLTDKEVCLFVAYSAEGLIEDYVIEYLLAIHNEGVKIILIIVTEGINELISSRLDFVEGILIRTNHGWDFAAWATALAVFPEVWRASLLILANDSVYGPTHPKGISNILKASRKSQKNIVALTDSYQVRHHLMSYFTVITTSGLQNKSIKDFWNGVRSNRNKQVVINEYEIKSIDRWNMNSVTWEVLYPTPENIYPPINPTLQGWSDLIEQGFPFVKVQLLRDFMNYLRGENWEDKFLYNSSIIPAIRQDLNRRSHKFIPPFRPVPSPKQRYIQSSKLKTFYGATTSVRPSDETDLALEVPFAIENQNHFEFPNKVAVIAHIFYTDFSPELIKALENSPVRTDVYISTDTTEKKIEIENFFENYNNGSIDVRITENIGRDIAPFLLGFLDVFDNYEIICHVHSKKSPHDSAFSGWREFLMDNLLGSKEVISSILYLLSSHEVGLVFSQHFNQVRNLINFGYNYETMQSLLSKCGIKLTQDLVLEFPSSSFFWARTEALRPLLNVGLRWSDFSMENGQVDGTLAHAIERSLLYITESTGLRWAKVGRKWRVPFEVLVPVLKIEDVEEAISRVHRPLINNRVAPPSQKNLVSELNYMHTRSDKEQKLRLTLLVPTLQPAKIFGGMTTALKLFFDINKNFEYEIDVRIISISERVDLISMLQFPDYVLLPTSAVKDNYPKVVLDASEQQRGFVGIRRNEVFIATAWWTASSAYELQEAQRKMYGRALPLLYLIQDHEPHFYSWSARHGEAERTYKQEKNIIPILNSEEFANFFIKKYNITNAMVLPYKINDSIKSALTKVKRERIILVYGRPSVERNCFPAICRALMLWQKSNPIVADRWRIISAGEDYDPRAFPQVQNMEVKGKLSLDEYAHLLSRASVGLSLMLSPHPSYPPLEMAYAGLKTITNEFDGKDLSLRSANVISVASIDPELISSALMDAINMAERMIDKIIDFEQISKIKCSIAEYDAKKIANIIYSLL